MSENNGRIRLQKSEEDIKLISEHKHKGRWWKMGEMIIPLDVWGKIADDWINRG